MASLSVLLLLDACHHAFLPRWKLIYVILNQNKLSSLGCLWPRYFITAMESVWCRNLTVAPSLLKPSLTPNRRKGPVLWRKTQIYPSISHVNNTHGCAHSDVSHLKPWCLWDGKNTNKIFFCPQKSLTWEHTWGDGVLGWRDLREDFEQLNISEKSKMLKARECITWNELSKRTHEDFTESWLNVCTVVDCGRDSIRTEKNSCRVPS